MKVVKSVCSLCHQMCGIDVHVDNGRVVKITGMKEHERHDICEKGLRIQNICISKQGS